MKIFYNGQYSSPKEEIEYLLGKLNSSNGELTKDDCDRITALSKLMNEMCSKFPIIEFKEQE